MARDTVLEASAFKELSQAARCFCAKALRDSPRPAIAVALFVCTLTFIASISNVSAQIATGRIMGRVTDASGAVIAGATVSITSDATA